jgi:hypothetical protein
MAPEQLLRSLRRIAYVLAGTGTLYLFVRYDLFDVPEVGCSPVVGVAPGARLLLDSWAEDARVDDVVLFRDANGALHIGRIVEPGEALGPEAVWIGGDDPDCPGYESAASGAVPRGAIRARVLVAF